MQGLCRGMLGFVLGCWPLAASAMSADNQAAPPTSKQRESEMFGGSDVDPPETTVPPPSAVDETPQRLDVASLGELVEAGNDILTIGGFFFLRSEYDVTEQGSASTFPLNSPNLLDLYFDARPSERVRGYFRGRAIYNPAIVNGQLSPLSLQSMQQTSLILDQFWLKFDVYRVAFVTAGRQPIRWGTGRFWNPTDFLNKQHRDPLAIFDQRVGATLLRVDVPLENLGWNLYAIANISDSQDFHDAGGALRAEIMLAQAEVSVTAYSRNDGPLQLGMDASTGMGLFDLRVEGALQRGVDQVLFRNDANLAAGQPPTPYTDTGAWFAQVVGGAELTLRYNDNDIITVGGEYFYNQLGYENSDDYLFAVVAAVQKGYAPPFLYLGRQYLALYANLSKPGNWNNSTATVTLLGNLTDLSFLSRIDFQVRVLTYMDFNFYGTYGFGREGEFRFVIPDNASSLLQTYFHAPEPIANLSQISMVPTVRSQIGVALRLYF